MALFSMFANAQQISYIKADGAWYQVYDEAGKKVTTPRTKCSVLMRLSRALVCP